MVMSRLLAESFSQGNQFLIDQNLTPKWIISGNDPKLSLRGVHLTFGPFPPPPDYVIQHWWSILSLVVPKEDSEFISHLQQKRVLKEAQEQGIFMRLNVRIMNRVEFKVIDSLSGVEIFSDTRDYVDLEFMSPHFNPWDELQDLDKKGEWELKWKWRMSDVDFLMQSQMMK